MISKLANVSEYMVEFRPLRFMKYMMYHLLFFYVGVAVNLLILIFDTKYIINNMSFWISTKNPVSFFVQIIQWISIMVINGSWA